MDLGKMFWSIALKRQMLTQFLFVHHSQMKVAGRIGMELRVWAKTTLKFKVLS